MPSSRSRIEKLEAVRGLAALYVVVAHGWGERFWFMKFGQEAVMVFFLLSGFVIEFTFARDPHLSFGTYFKKRWVRIYPPLLLLFGLVMILGHSETQKPDFLTDLIGNLLMLQDFDLGKPHVLVPTLYAPALWSLHYEWWFYMLFFPFRRYLAQTQATRVVISLSLLSALAYLFFPYAAPRLLMYFLSWWIGVIMAQSYQRHGRVIAKELFPALAGMVGICALLGVKVAWAAQSGQNLLFGLHPILELRHFTAALFATLGALLWQRIKWIGFSPIMVGQWFAPISYTLYIAHQPLWAYAEYGQEISPSWAQSGLRLTVLILFCYLTELKLYPWLRQKFISRN